MRKMGKFRVKVIERIIPQPPPGSRDDVIIIGLTPDGERMRLQLFENQIKNLPDNSRYNIEPGMELEVSIKYGEEINSFNEIQAKII